MSDLTELVVQAVPLALLDTISVSTLAIPLWFLLTPRGLRLGNVYLYLLFVASTYLVLGVLLAGFLDRFRDRLAATLAHPVGDIALAVAGATLILVGLWHGLRKRRGSGNGRLTRWREAAVGEGATLRGLVSVSLFAVLFEVATMFPYLIVLDTLARSSTSWYVSAAVLVLYCAVMVAPALVATSILLVSRRPAQPILLRVDDWLRRNSRENTAWLLGLFGFLLLSNSTAFARVIELLGR